MININLKKITVNKRIKRIRVQFEVISKIRNFGVDRIAKYEHRTFDQKSRKKSKITEDLLHQNVLVSTTVFI